MSCGSLNFTRTWARVDNSCNNLGFTQEQLDMRRKAEILEYKQNSVKLTKRERYAQIAKGGGPQRKKSWTNTTNLTQNGNVLTCNTSSITSAPSSASDVPGNMTLTFNKSIPLIRYKVRRTYT